VALDLSYLSGVTGARLVRSSTCELRTSVPVLAHLPAGLPLPPSVTGLLGLTQLLLDDNSLGSSLPPSYSLLSKLQSLTLQSNQLTGTLPAQWSALTDLKASAPCQSACAPEPDLMPLSPLADPGSREQPAVQHHPCVVACGHVQRQLLHHVVQHGAVRDPPRRLGAGRRSAGGLTRQLSGLGLSL
jgi:hypothetical protein